MYTPNRFVEEKVDKTIIFFQKYSQNSSNLVQSNVNHEIKHQNVHTFVLFSPIVLYSFRIVNTSGFQNGIPNVYTRCGFIQQNKKPWIKPVQSDFLKKYFFKEILCFQYVCDNIHKIKISNNSALVRAFYT